MAWFKCIIRGENFPGQLVGGEDLVGFYVVRFVEAADPDAAEVAAVKSLRGEPLALVTAVLLAVLAGMAILRG